MRKREAGEGGMRRGNGETDKTAVSSPPRLSHLMLLKRAPQACTRGRTESMMCAACDAGSVFLCINSSWVPDLGLAGMRDIHNH